MNHIESNHPDPSPPQLPGPSSVEQQPTAPAAPVPGAPGHFAAPYGYDPYGRPYSDKSKTVAGVLQIALGSLGIGRFYIGDNKIGAWQCTVSILTLGIGALWGIVDGAIMLGTEGKTDSEGRVLR